MTWKEDPLSWLKINKYLLSHHTQQSHIHSVISSRATQIITIITNFSLQPPLRPFHRWSKISVRGRFIPPPLLLALQPAHHGSYRVHRHHKHVEIRLLWRRCARQAVVRGWREVVVGGRRRLRDEGRRRWRGGTRAGRWRASALPAAPLRAGDDEEEGDQAAEGGDVPDYRPGVQGRLVLRAWDCWGKRWLLVEWTYFW